MSKDVCIALTAVFPLILLIVLLDGRLIRSKLRGTLYSWAAGGGSMLAIFGLLISVIGVQTDGLKHGWEVVAWGTFGLSLVAMTTIMLLLALTFDGKDGRTNWFQRRREARK